MAERSSLVARADHGQVPCQRCGFVREVAGGRPAAALCADCRYVEGLTVELDLDDVLVEFHRFGLTHRGTVRCHCGATLPRGARGPIDCTDCRAWARAAAARAPWPREWWAVAS